MEKCEGLVENDCDVRLTHDLKGNLEQSSCLSDNSKGLEKSVEDKNRNITSFSTSVKDEIKDDQSASSSSKRNLISAHGGPNGLINGLELGSGEKLTHLLEHIPNSSVHENLMGSDSSSHSKSVKKSSEIKSEHCTKVNSEEGCNHSNIDSLTNADLEGSKKDEIPVVKDSKIDDDSGSSSSSSSSPSQIEYVSYESELQMPDIMRLIQKDLSEPYSIYTYRYFIHNWPKLCFLAMDGSKCVGAIVCKLDIHRKIVKRGYIAMLAVDEKYRKRKIGSNLVLKAIRAMVADDADEVVLETEITNQPALRLYENLGFVRDKRLFRYYLNGVDALRLKLWLR